ncbi:MAG: hypothetical protein PHE89_03690 [Alphaproteobacteria bacterium]|nr:hypothetical protein [Alphaproteobacteria bacterium]
MIIDSSNKTQASIIANKCFYQTIAKIMRDFEEKGYDNSADETAKVVAAYHSLVGKKSKNTYNDDYNQAFKQIDTSIQTIAHQVFYQHETERFDMAYKTFESFDYINAIVTRQHTKKIAI